MRSVAAIFRLKFQRIQFTPDLMPADIIGTEILQESGGERRLEFHRGRSSRTYCSPDEINRTPPKTQAALLESMQEHQVTVAGVRHALDLPFFVLATQNRIEMEGTYPLPEGQLDRFMFNVVLDYLPEDDEVEVVLRTTSTAPEVPEAIFDGDDVQTHSGRRAPSACRRRDRALCSAPRRGEPAESRRLARVRQSMGELGRRTRAGQSLILGSKARALLHGAHARQHRRRAQPRALHVASSRLGRLPRRSRGRLGGTGDRPHARRGSGQHLRWRRAR